MIHIEGIYTIRRDDIKDFLIKLNSTSYFIFFEWVKTKTIKITPAKISKIDYEI